MQRLSLLFITAAAFALACLSYAAGTGAQSSREPKRLFDPVAADGIPNKSADRSPAARPERARTSAAAVREQEINVNFGSINFAEARELSLPLFGGPSYTAVRSESEGFAASPGGGFVWRGKIFGPGGWTGDVTLSAEGRALSGLIYSPEGVYEIVPQRDFGHLLVRLDQSRFPPCGGAFPAPEASEAAATAAAATSAGVKAAGAIEATAAADDGSVIDVLVVYTDDVRTTLGGTTQAEAFAQEAVNTTNTAYINSDIHTRLRLAGTLEVNYAETGDLSAALSWVGGDATVSAARNSLRADLVALIVNRGTACGVGRLMSHSLLGAGFQHAAYSVTARGCAVGNLSFAHELGHNQGCQHNPENGGPPEGLAYPYAYGHYVDQSFRTVMSYSDPCTSPNFCPRVAYFSNPSVNYNGVPTGIADQRDNHRVINNTAVIVSLFRESTVAAPPANDNFANPAPLGGPSGTFTGSNNGSTTMTTAGSTFNTVLAVYTGSAYGGLTAVASNDDVNFATGESSVTFNATAGTNYRIAVDGYAAGVTGSLKLGWNMELPAGGALLNPDFFVRQHYRDFLGREPDDQGLGFWTNEIASCGGDPGCVEVKRVNVSAAFFLSIEFQETGYLVYRLQQSSFGTRPTFAPFMADARQVAQGLVVGQAGWQDRLESNKAAFVEAWVQRPAFLAEFPAGMTAQEYVGKLFQRAGVSPTAAEVQSAAGAYGGGGDTQGRARALRAVAESQTLTLAHKNAAYVMMEYFGYLRRDPDEEGFRFWLTKLDAFNGDAVAAEMVKAFITSIEYRQRFGP